VIGFGLWPGALVGWSEAETGALALRAQPFLAATASSPITVATAAPRTVQGLPRTIALIPAAPSPLAVPSI